MDYKVEKLAFLDAPVPAKTASYTPVPNRMIMDTVYRYLDKMHVPVVQEIFRMNEKQTQFQATIVTPGNSDLGMALYFTNSYDKTRKFSVGSGAIVFRCTNGMIRIDLKDNMSRKHTGELGKEVNFIIYNSIDTLSDEFDQVTRDKQLMEEFIFPDVRVLHELVGKMFLNDLVLSTTQFSVLQSHLKGNEWHTMLDEDNCLIGNPTMWDFYNCATEALKSNLPFNYVDKHVELHNFLLDEVARY